MAFFRKKPKSKLDKAAIQIGTTLGKAAARVDKLGRQKDEVVAGVRHVVDAGSKIGGAMMSDLGRAADQGKTAMGKAVKAAGQASADLGRAADQGRAAMRKASAAASQATSDLGRAADQGRTAMRKAAAAASKATADLGRAADQGTAAMRKAAKAAGKVPEVKKGVTLVSRATKTISDAAKKAMKRR